MKKKIYLPKSLEELKSMDKESRESLWKRYYKGTKIFTSPRMYRMLWYKVQCENRDLKIETRILSRLYKYAKDPDKYVQKALKKKHHIRNGTEIVKKYKGKEYRVLVRSDKEFIYNNKVYPTISAVAKAICGIKVSGNNFFGLDAKHYRDNIVKEEICKD